MIHSSSMKQTIIIYILILIIHYVFPTAVFAEARDSIDHWISSSIIKDLSGTNIIKVDTIPLYRALLESGIEDNFDQLFMIHYLYGVHHNINREPLKALKYFQIANIVKVSETKNSHEIDILVAMGNSFQYLGKSKEAIVKYQKALTILKTAAQTSAASIKKLGVMTNIANSYAKNGQLEESLKSYQEVYETSLKLTSEDPKFESRLNTARSNMGFIHLELNQPRKALEYLSDYHDFISKSDEDSRSLAASFGNLAYCEYLLNNYDKAYEYYNSSLDISEKNGFPNITYITYKDLSDTYMSEGKTREAITYLNKHYELKDSLQGEKSQSEFNNLEIKYQTNLMEQEILQLEQKNHIQRQQLFITYGGLGILLLLCFFIYAYFKQLGQRKKESALFKLDQAKQREELQALKLDKLNQELFHKKQDITKLAMRISQKQEFSNELLHQLDQLKKYVKPEASKDWHKLGNTIKNRLQTNDEQLLFLDNIEEINQAFFDKLHQHYPNLTKSEQELCGFIRLGLSGKEIANLRSVSPEAVRMGRYRLRKKLSLDSSQDVKKILQAI